jgi:hypothetical protein
LPSLRERRLGDLNCSRPGIRVELGDADFFDLHHSAFFNSLPVARDGLLAEGAAAREYTMRFVRVPELTAEPAWQRYEPVGNRVGRCGCPAGSGRAPAVDAGYLTA